MKLLRAKCSASFEEMAPRSSLSMYQSRGQKVRSVNIPATIICEVNIMSRTRDI